MVLDEMICAKKWNPIKYTIAGLALAASVGTQGCVSPYGNLGRALDNMRREPTAVEQKAAYEKEFAAYEEELKNPVDYKIGEYLQKQGIPLIRTAKDFDALVDISKQKPVVVFTYTRFSKVSLREAKVYANWNPPPSVMLVAIADDAVELAPTVDKLRKSARTIYDDVHVFWNGRVDRTIELTDYNEARDFRAVVLQYAVVAAQQPKK